MNLLLSRLDGCAHRCYLTAACGLLAIVAATIGNVPRMANAGSIDVSDRGGCLAPSCPGDFDSDNAVTEVDVSGFVTALLAEGSCAVPPACCQADLNSDELVDGADIPEFLTKLFAGGVCPLAPVNLRSLSTFAVVAGAGLSNSNFDGQTTINGDVGLSPTATCLGDGAPCSAVNPLINGTLYANDPGGIAAAAMDDLTLAYIDAASRPPGTTVSDITGMVLSPGVYTSGSVMTIAIGGTLILDAQTDANAVWIFQIGSALTVNNGAQVLLLNGAKASNVYWAVSASSVIGSGVSFKGNVLAGASNSVGTGSTVEGRLLCNTGQITLLSNTINLPAP